MADILLVEDDDDVALLMEAFLEDDGHSVRVAHDGEEGLARLRDKLPDLVLLDVEMPVMGGPGMAAEMIAENAGKERIPLLMISGTVGLSAIAAMVGTPYFLAKPFLPNELMALVGRALRERRPPSPPRRTSPP